MKTNKLDKELRKAVQTHKIKIKWDPDPKGYFTIKPFFSKKKIFVRFYNYRHKLKHTFSGISTMQIIHEFVRRKLLSRLDHAAYLGKEIEKAMLALKYRLNYVQDEDLDLKEGGEKR